MCWSLFLFQALGLPCNFIKRRLQHRCFPVKFAKFIRAPILKNICKQLLLLRNGSFEIVIIILKQIIKTDNLKIDPRGLCVVNRYRIPVYSYNYRVQCGCRIINTYSKEMWCFDERFASICALRWQSRTQTLEHETIIRTGTVLIMTLICSCIALDM